MVQQQELSRLLQQGDLDALFRTMGWDNPEQRLPVDVTESALSPVPVADKRGVTAWRVDCPNGLPKRSEQHRVVRHLKRLSRDQLVVFVSPDRASCGSGPNNDRAASAIALLTTPIPAGAPTDASAPASPSRASFTIDEEEHPHLLASVLSQSPPARSTLTEVHSVVL